MAGQVKGYETNFDEDVQPNSLHGVRECKLLIIQCADDKSKTEVLLGIEVAPGDIRIFPKDSWASLGRPSSWLQEQLETALYGKAKVKEKLLKKPQTAQSDVVTKSKPTTVELDSAV